jgi:hypothetical protein
MIQGHKTVPIFTGRETLKYEYTKEEWPEYAAMVDTDSYPGNNHSLYSNYI